MRIAYVVQRYGPGVAGGAEEHTRMFAERLAARGHDVHVYTTRALSYVDWADALPGGSSALNGVTVHRFPVANKRDRDRFGDLHLRITHASGPVLLDVQREWLRFQGPEAPQLVAALVRDAPSFDRIVVSTYLYWTTWAALRAVSGVVPTVLHPTAHDEPMLGMSLFDETFRLPDVICYLTPEERALVERRFRRLPRGSVVGVGVDPPHPTDGSRLEDSFELAGRPYLCYVGRVDTAKAVDELLRYFGAYKQRQPGPLALVLVGEATMPVPAREDLVTTGFIDAVRRDVLVQGAIAIVQPSYYESFSMVVTEAFAAGKPTILNGRCEVLAGHARRSGAAITYHDERTFGTALDRLRDDPLLAASMGAAGREYVEREYGWEVVLDRYERLLASARS